MRRLARTRRCVTASGVERKLRAISRGVKPHTVCSVSIVCSSSERAGWQATNMRASVSSGLPVSSGLENPRRQAAASSCGSSGSSRASRRSRSSALLRAAIASHAAGRSGVPEYAHWASAAAKASCTASSIRSSRFGPSRRTSQALILPASCRNSASSWASAAGMEPQSSSIWRTSMWLPYFRCGQLSARRQASA